MHYLTAHTSTVASTLLLVAMAACSGNPKIPTNLNEPVNKSYPVCKYEGIYKFSSDTRGLETLTPNSGTLAINCRGQALYLAWLPVGGSTIGNRLLNKVQLGNSVAEMESTLPLPARAKSIDPFSSNPFANFNGKINLLVPQDLSVSGGDQSIKETLQFVPQSVSFQLTLFWKDSTQTIEAKLVRVLPPSNRDFLETAELLIQRATIVN